MAIKIEFDVKYGKNTIEIPINAGDKQFLDCGRGLSNLFDKTFTIINQIPTSETVSTKIAWKKHIISKCDVAEGIYDKSSGTMVYNANTFTAYLKNWEKFREPNFSENGYYYLYNTDDTLYTASVGDLLILREIQDPEPTSAKEFNALRTKYSNEGGILTGKESFLNYRPNGTPWKTNHIELIKG